MSTPRTGPLTPGMETHPVPTAQEAGWAPGPVWTGAENLVPTGFRSPDRPAQSLSRPMFTSLSVANILVSHPLLSFAEAEARKGNKQVILVFRSFMASKLSRMYKSTQYLG